MKCRIKYTIEGWSDEAFKRLDKTTVFRSENSPTGYVVSFRFRAPDRSEVSVLGDWMFSDIHHSSRWDSGRYWPHQWQKEYFPHTLLGLKKTPHELKDGTAGENIEVSRFEFDWDILKLGLYEMEKNEYGIFSCTIPLPSGVFNYRFVTDMPDGNPMKMVTVPDDCTLNVDVKNNSTVEKDNLADMKREYSQIKIPYDPEKQTDNREAELGSRNGKRGSLRYVKYPTDENFGAGKYQTAGIYLPYEYDCTRKKPYSVLYLSHGGSDQVTSWMTQGAVPDMMDYLIENKMAEPMIIVTMDNEVFKWDNMGKCIPNLVGYLMPFVEKNYNAAGDAKGRSFAGMSAGGFLAFDVYESVGYLFGHIGIWSGGRRRTAEYSRPFLKKVKVHVGAGRYDDAFFSFGEPLENELSEWHLPFTSYTPDGGHQWSVWRKLFEDFVTRVLKE